MVWICSCLLLAARRSYGQQEGNLHRDEPTGSSGLLARAPPFL